MGLRHLDNDSVSTRLLQSLQPALNALEAKQGQRQGSKTTKPEPGTVRQARHPPTKAAIWGSPAVT